MRTLLFLVSSILLSSVAWSDDAVVGVTVQDVASLDAETLKRSRLPVKNGVLLREVADDSAAAKGGLLPNDVIVKVDGKDVDLAQFKASCDGGEHKLLIYRFNNRVWSRKTLAVTLPRVAKRSAGAVANRSADTVAKHSAAVEAEIAAATAEVAAATAPVAVAEREAAIGELAKWESQLLALDPTERPFELKGDRLGMTLAMFKAKHHRIIEKTIAPFCSDKKPDNANPMLSYTPELGKLGIIHGRTTFPFEEIADKSKRVTIAGVPAELYLYHFIDGKLYQISILLAHDDFQQVRTAMQKKYGDPSTTKTETYQNAFGAKYEGDLLIWSNSVSQVTAFERAGRLDTSAIHVSHRELSNIAENRKAEAKVDDL